MRVLPRGFGSDPSVSDLGRQTKHKRNLKRAVSAPPALLKAAKPSAGANAWWRSSQMLRALRFSTQKVSRPFLLVRGEKPTRLLPTAPTWPTGFPEYSGYLA